MSLTPGTRLGPYEILAAIGAGGMGEVYRATDSNLKRSVAIKVLPASVAGDADRLARFQREAEVLAALNHPNIAAIYGLEKTPDFTALVMELVEGEDLSAHIARGAIPLAESLPIAKQIADALEAAHDQGIIHRDLKPANIKVRADGVVKVLDFGLAKATEGANTGAGRGSGLANSPTMTSPAMTAMGMILGTAAYMAPEQARGKVVDKRADVWAFGVVLFEMLTGRRAFPGDDVTDTIVSVVTQEPDWSALPAATPAGLRRLLARALKKDPKARLRDIREARLQIEELQSGAQDEIGPPMSIAPALPPRPASPRALTWILAASTCVLAATSVLLWAPWRSAPPQMPNWTFARKTFVAQAVFNARFMPDGVTIVFSAALSGTKSELFETRPDSAAPTAFGPPNTRLLAVSKTGELAVLTGATYLGHRVMSGTLARMTRDGAPRAIADDVRDADWLPDGSEMAVVRHVQGGDQLEFPLGQVVHRTTGYLSDMRVSPDGTRVAFMDHPVEGDDRGWVRVVDRAGVVTRLAGEYNEEEGVAWSADGRTVFFATTRVMSVPSSGRGKPTALTSSPGTLYLLDVAADGRMLVIRDDSRTGVVAKGAGQTAERGLSIRENEWGPTLSPNGQFAVFTQGGNSRDYAIFMRGVEGSRPSKLGPGNSGAFSPNGQWVTASLLSTGRCVVYPTGAGTPVPVEMGPLESCTDAMWFPDNKNLILVGKEPGQPLRTYRAAFPGGTPQALLPATFSAQGIRASSACLLAKDAGGGWRRFDLNGPSSPVLGLLPTDALLGCPAGGQSAYVGDNTVVPALVYLVDLATGRRTKKDEVAPVDRAGLLQVEVTVYRDEGRQYAYGYLRGVSTLYVATPGK